MNLKDQRQSKNVEDIRKQKPKMTNGWVIPKMEGAQGEPYMAIRNAQVSKKKANQRNLDKPASLMKKAGVPAMEEAAKKDSIKNKYLQQEKKDLDDLLDKAFDEKNKGGAGGHTKLNKAEAPKTLTEIWTPRPLKK